MPVMRFKRPDNSAVSRQKEPVTAVFFGWTSQSVTLRRLLSLLLPDSKLAI
jgi:hypothetical protein